MTTCTPDRLAVLLLKLTLTPAEFAQRYDLSEKLVTKWLNNSAPICAATARLLEIIESQPEITRKR